MCIRDSRHVDGKSVHAVERLARDLSTAVHGDQVTGRSRVGRPWIDALPRRRQEVVLCDVAIGAFEHACGVGRRRAGTGAVDGGETLGS